MEVLSEFKGGIALRTHKISTLFVWNIRKNVNNYNTKYRTRNTYYRDPISTKLKPLKPKSKI